MFQFLTFFSQINITIMVKVKHMISKMFTPEIIRLAIWKSVSSLGKRYPTNFF